MKRRSFLGAIGCVSVIAHPAYAANGVPRKPSEPKSARRSRRVGIALSGGSIHGLAHVGVLKAFAEKGLAFQYIAGTSAGAIVGALEAARLLPREMEMILRRIEWPGVTSLSWSGKGLMQHAKLRSLIDSALGDRRIEQLPIAFGAIATDVATGERVILRTGATGTAVSASASIPVLFEPVKIEGRDLVDGGLTEPVPVVAVREMGADFVIGVDVAFRPDEDRFQGLTGIAFQTMHIMGNALIREQLPRADIAIRMNLHPLIGMENSHEQLISAGYAETMRVWPRLAAALA